VGVCSFPFFQSAAAALGGGKGGGTFKERAVENYVITRYFPPNISLPFSLLSRSQGGIATDKNFPSLR